MRISYSSMDTYTTCPLKYKFRSIDRIPEPKSKEAMFGTLVHAVLRYAHTPALIPPTVEQALDFFSKGFRSDVYENELEERSAFSQGVEMIQAYYEQNEIAKYNIVDLESRFAIEIGNDFDGKHVISGIVDRIDKTKDGYEIIDYKTTRRMPSQDKVDNDLQLSIYLLAFLNRYPKERPNLKNLTVSLYFLKHGVKLSSTRSEAQLVEVEKRFLDVIRSIEAGKFDPILNPLCDWCGYQKICPLWKHKFAETRRVETADVKAAIGDYIGLKNKMSADKLHMAKLQSMILEYMDQEGVERVFDEDGIIGTTVRQTFKYDESRLREILEPLDKWESILKVDGVALRNIMAVLPSPIQDGIEEAKILDKESKTLSVKKNKMEIDPDLGAS